MSTMSEPADSELRCPVCRAAQTPQPQCRRCGADLALLVHALDAIRDAQQQLEQARRSGDVLQQRRLQQYLDWLTGTSYT
jgi:hypothetical protein